MNHADLTAKGFTQQPDGTWSKRSAVRAVETSISKPTATPTLANGPKKYRQRKGRVAVVVTLIATIGRELDSDNLQGACKPLRDAIAESLGLDDGDGRIRWEYGQCETRGQQGVIVKVALKESEL